MLAAVVFKRKSLAKHRRQQNEVIKQEKILIENGQLINREILNKPDFKSNLNQSNNLEKNKISEEDNKREKRRQEALRNLIELKKLAREITGYVSSENSLLIKENSLDKILYSTQNQTETPTVEIKNESQLVIENRRNEQIIENSNFNELNDIKLRANSIEKQEFMGKLKLTPLNLSMDSEKHSEMGLDDGFVRRNQIYNKKYV
jgi:hypothetical protein